MENLKENCGDSSVCLQKLIDSITYFDENEKHKVLCLSLKNLKISFSKCALSAEEIRNFAPEYDFNVETPGNGYRSFVDIFDAAVIKVAKICERLIRNREKFVFRVDKFAK